MGFLRMISILLVAVLGAASVSLAALTPNDQVQACSGSYHNTAYYTNWAMYEANYLPQQLPASELSMVLYAFANLLANGTVYGGDSWADVEVGEDWSAPNPSENAWGNVRQLYLLKKANRQLKVLLSIGGWSWSTNFPAAASTQATRAIFATTAVTLMKDWGFDGIDIDWESPATTTEADDFVLLLQAVRDEMDKYAAQHASGYHFLLTVASPAGPLKYTIQNLSAMAGVVDYFNLMAYDYAGAWDTTSGHSANLYHDSENAMATKFSTDAAITAYLVAGVPASKIILGMPAYGHSFEATTSIGGAYTGVGPGQFPAQPGIWNYNMLPLTGADNYTDSVSGATYSYNNASQELISYDTADMVAQKVAYLLSKGLAGSMFWEASGDRDDSESLILASYNALGGSCSLDSTQNLLSYPNSTYPNIASGTG